MLKFSLQLSQYKVCYLTFCDSLKDFALDSASILSIVPDVLCD